MQERLLDKIAEPFNIKLPEQSTMDATIDSVLSVVAKESNAITEEEYYVDRQWIEMSEELSHSAVVLYVFQEGGRLLISTNGRIESASWSLLDRTQKMILSTGTRGGELYNLAFLDEDFFIIKHHGDPRAHEHRYRLFVNERIAGRLEWNEALELLYAKYRNTNSTFLAVALFVLLAIIIMVWLSYGGSA